MTDTPAPAPTFKYKAFISYRHADKAWGEWLHKALETYPVPRELVGKTGRLGLIPAKLGRVFRDREELSAAHDLGSMIQQALSESETLVVLCSPRAAQSKYVNEEILTYKRMGRGDHIYPIVVDGEPNSADPAQECFPPALKYTLDAEGNVTSLLAEPLAADAREKADGRENAKLKLISGLLGVDYDQLKRRQLEAERRAFRRWLTIAASLVVLFAAIAGVAVWSYLEAERQREIAVTERQRAETERDRAEHNMMVATRTAGEILTNVNEKMAGSEGAQAIVLQDIAIRVRDLLDQLSGGSNNTEGKDFTKATRARANCNIADSKLKTGDAAGALADAERCLADLQPLEAIYPDPLTYKADIAAAQEKIGDAKNVSGDRKGALAAYDLARGLIDERVKANTQDAVALTDFWRIWMKIAAILEADGRHDDALQAYQGSLKVADLLARDPSNTEALRSKYLTLKAIGELKYAKADVDGALADFTTALELSDRFLALSSNPLTNHLSENAALHGNVGDIHYARRDYAQALEHHRKALEIRQRLATGDASNVWFQHDLWKALIQIAQTEVKMGDTFTANSHASDAVAIAERLSAADPNPLWQEDLGLACYVMAVITATANDIPASLSWLDRAETAQTKLAASDPANQSYADALAKTRATRTQVQALTPTP